MSGNLIEQGQSLFRVFDIETRDGKTGVDDDVIPGRDPLDQRDRYSATNSTHLGFDPLVREKRFDSDRHGEAHTSGRNRGSDARQRRWMRDPVLA